MEHIVDAALTVKGPFVQRNLNILIAETVMVFLKKEREISLKVCLCLDGCFQRMASQKLDESTKMILRNFQFPLDFHGGKA